MAKLSSGTRKRMPKGEFAGPGRSLLAPPIDIQIYRRNLEVELAEAEYAKRSKPSVDYSYGKPHAHCGLCRHFTAPHECALVQGNVAKDMWCKLFEDK